jgi:hypothetical protein
MIKPFPISLFLLMTGIFFVAPACKKEEKTRTKKELISNGSWILTSYTVNPAIDYNGDGTDESDIYAVMEQCVKDDRTTFEADGMGTIDEGSTKCDPSDDQTIPITWSLTVNDTQLNVDGEQYTVISLDESQLVLKQLSTFNTAAVTHNIIFSH